MILKWKLVSACALTLSLTAGAFHTLNIQAADEKQAQKGEKEQPKKPGEGDKGDKPKIGDGDKPKKLGEGDKPKKPGEGRPDQRKIVGNISDADETAKAITITTKGDAGEQKTIVSITAETKITVDGKPGKLSTLPNNARVEVHYAPATKQGDPIVATSLTIGGVERRRYLSRVDGKKLFFKTEGGEGELELAPDVKVFLKQEEIKIADLKPGDAITTTMSTDDTTVLRIVLTKRAGGAPGEKDKPKENIEKQ